MSNIPVRVRFAPSPTGPMHLGNVRTALLNYLFALQKSGTFVLRIEDTDPERNFDPDARQIISDMQWLRLTYTEGPQVGGPFAPYFQSQRVDIYKKVLDELISKGVVYQCFCTSEELEKKRKRQIELRMAPRYDKTCLKLSKEEINKKLDENIPFIWRVKLDHEKEITIRDIAHNTIKFSLKNFSDFPITRQDETYTFMFANFVDDMHMKITHILRGEDHLTNSAGQAALYEELGKPLPTFWHLPILCDINGKKLSKRDFGFALKDLKNSGYLSEAICNYLAIIGGSFKNEIMSLDELARSMDFDRTNAKGQIKFDEGKLSWINHKWIDRYDPEKLTTLCLPHLTKEFPEAEKIKRTDLTKLIQAIKTDLVLLKDVVQSLRFYFEPPKITKTEVKNLFEKNHLVKLSDLVSQQIDKISKPENFLQDLKKEILDKEIPTKGLYHFLRLALTGATKGPGIKELIDMLGKDEAKKRIEQFIKIVG